MNITKNYDCSCTIFLAKMIDYVLLGYFLIGICTGILTLFGYTYYIRTNVNKLPIKSKPLVENKLQKDAFSGIIVTIRHSYDHFNKIYDLELDSDEPTVLYKTIMDNPKKFIESYGYGDVCSILSIKIYKKDLSKYQKIMKLLGLSFNKDTTESKLLSLIESHLEYQPDGPGYISAKNDFESI